MAKSRTLSLLASFACAFHLIYVQSAQGITPPIISTFLVTNVTGTTATLIANINPNGLATGAWVQWGGNVGDGNTSAVTNMGSGTAAKSLTNVLSGLQAGQVYHCIVKATNASGQAMSMDTVFEAPGLILLGGNVVTSSLHAAFFDPGAQLSSLPLGLASGDLYYIALKGDGRISLWGQATTIPANATNITAIAANGYCSDYALDDFGAGLRSNGTVMAWGANDSSQLNIPSDVSNVVSFAAGEDFVMALKSNGTAEGWGATAEGNSDGQATAPAGLSNIVAVSCGADYTLALKNDGTLSFWGDSFDSPPAGLTNIIAVSAGGVFAMALKGNGTVTAWGDNSYGELNIPAGLSNVTAISAGWDFGLALKSNGTVVAWGGADGYGMGQANVPGGLNNVAAICAGGGNGTLAFFGLALQSNGTLVTWGTDSEQTLAPLTGLTNVNGIYGVVGTVNTNVAGSYVLSYSTTNFLGAITTVNRTVIVMPPPVVTTLAASNLTNNNANVGATLNGSVNPSAFATMAWFQWGNTVAYGNVTTSFAAGNGTSPVLIAAGLANLQAGQVYHYRLVATNSSGFGYGEDRILQVPDLLLDGTSPLIVDYGSPYVDPGISLAASPLGIAGGASNSVALKGDGTLAAWGDNSHGQTNTAGLSNIIAIAAGGNHGLALKNNGTVVGWGDNSSGENNIPASVTNVIAIAAGVNHSMAVLSNGTVVCWGSNASGQTNVPSSLNNVVAVAGGTTHSVALQNTGAVVGWGDNTYGQLNIATSATNVVAISAGEVDSLALCSNGTLVAWGFDNYGQTNIPPGLNNVIAIASGSYFHLALQNNGTVTAWGDNTYGQTNIPSGLANVVAIACGSYHGIALLGNGSIVSWGDNANGQTNVPPGLNMISGITGTNDAVNVAVPGTYTVTYTASNFMGDSFSVTRQVIVQTYPPTTLTLPITDAGAGSATFNATVNPNSFAAAAWFQWGTSPVYGNTTTATLLGSGSSALPVSQTVSGLQPGQVYHESVMATNSVGSASGVDEILELPSIALNGSNTMTNVYRAPFVDPGVTLTGSPLSICVGDTFCLAVKGDGSLVEWGRNPNNAFSPPSNATNIIAICAYDTILALQNNGHVVNWGYNDGGEGNVPNGLSNVVALALGEANAMALRSDGTLVLWGDNYWGETQPPTGLNSVRAIAASPNDFDVALQIDGTVMVWGYGGDGETNVPAGLSNVVAISAGMTHILALQSNGMVVGWGDNSSGEINIPSGLTNAVAVAAGAYYSLVLKSDGTVVGFGDTSEEESVVPAGLSNVVAIAADNADGICSLALTSSGTIVGWGINYFGQLTPPSGLTNLSTPVTTNGSVNTSVAGGYSITYTVTNLFGAAGAVVRSVVVLPTPPVSLSATSSAQGQTNQQITLQFSGDTNTSYNVLGTTNLALPLADWQVLGPATLLSNGVFQFIDTPSTNFPDRYYMLQTP